MSFESAVESFANAAARGGLAFGEWTMRWARRREVKRKNRPEVLEELDKAYAKVHAERMKLRRRRAYGNHAASTGTPNTRATTTDTANANTTSTDAPHPNPTSTDAPAANTTSTDAPAANATTGDATTGGAASSDASTAHADAGEPTAVSGDVPAPREREITIPSRRRQADDDVSDTTSE